MVDWNLRQYSEAATRLSLIGDDYESSNVWEIQPARDPVHNAVFPSRLAENVVRLYSFAGDTIMDPFAGSGTVGVCATALKRHFFLVESEARYVERMVDRLRSEVDDLLDMQVMTAGDLRAHSI